MIWNQAEFFLDLKYQLIYQATQFPNFAKGRINPFRKTAETFDLLRRDYGPPRVSQVFMRCSFWPTAEHTLFSRGPSLCQLNYFAFAFKITFLPFHLTLFSSIGNFCNSL